jgi:multidrug resistance efflux pump
VGAQVNELAREVAGLGRELAGLTRELAERLRGIAERLDDLEGDIKDLQRRMFLGNGGTTIMERLQTAEHERHSMRAAVDAIRRDLETLIEKRDEADAADRAGRWSFKSAVWPAIIALIASGGAGVAWLVGWLIQHITSKGPPMVGPPQP